MAIPTHSACSFQLKAHGLCAFGFSFLPPNFANMDTRVLRAFYVSSFACLHPLPRYLGAYRFGVCLRNAVGFEELCVTPYGKGLVDVCMGRELLFDYDVNVEHAESLQYQLEHKRLGSN